MFKKLGLYSRTVKHLKPIQIRYRLWYMLRNKFRNLTGHSYPLSIPKKGQRLDFKPDIPKPASCNLQPATSKVEFTFLNRSHSFDEAIDWNFNQYGKLWVYNLNYFDYLHQPEMTKEHGLELIREFIEDIDANREGLEPYPISLRGINWIKFLSEHEIKDEQIDASLYAQYQILLDNLEYHLLGNHLLENGCSLLFGAYYFQDEELYEKAKEILSNELEEQILPDGGHFERSTMYHGILLERLMDCCNLMKGNEWVEDEELKGLLKGKVELMLGWLEQLTVDGGLLTAEEASPVDGCQSSDVPLLNDAAKEIGPEPVELFDYANSLGLKAEKMELGESGYRRYSTDHLDLICDVGAIGPDYQPGHAHSDTFSFVLYHKEHPVIIDPGISTYENNDQRQLERSTQFHNTVQFEDKEQSEVWSAFRVGRRAKAEVLEEGEKKLAASHDGYRPWGVRHKREWTVEDVGIEIDDWLMEKDSAKGTLFLHFHPRWTEEIRMKDNSVSVGGVEISFAGAESIKKCSYNCPDGYNRYKEAPKLEVTFVGRLITRIHQR